MPKRTGTVEPDADVDTSATESDTAPATSGEGTAESTETRPPVPEGYVSPIGFVKVLKAERGIEIKPQMVYSYLNQYSKGDNAFPVHEAGGRKNLIVPSEGLAWWDAKEARKVERKANAEAKEAKKAAAASKRAASSTEAEAGDATEAEAGDFTDAE